MMIATFSEVAGIPFQAPKFMFNSLMLIDQKLLHIDAF